MEKDNKKRITLKLIQPNPLFEEWLTEWRDKAKESNSKMQHCFSLALSSLRKYPLPLESGRDCKILKGFGEKLCTMLDDKLKKYKAENPNFHAKGNNNVQLNVPKSNKKSLLNSPSKSSPQEYIPQYRSGAFAILVTLYEKSTEPEYPGHLTKNQIMQMGQNLCDVSFTKPLPDSRYTAWSSMRTLLEKRLVIKHGSPAKFSLTGEGSALADKLYVQHKIEEFQRQEDKEQLNPLEIKKLASVAVPINDLAVPSCSGLHNKKSKSSSSSSPKKKNKPIRQQTSSATSTSDQTNSIAHETVIIAPNSFEVILLVDNQELSAGRIDLENEPIIRELKSLNVRHEARNLKIGDYTWICRDNFGNEVVLPYIVERKRMDDLGQSIKDGRFHEQKFRLKQSGIENITYLIESYGKNERVGLPINTLYQAALNTLVHNGFCVRFTDNGSASCEYLASCTSFLETLFKNKTLVSCPKEDLPQFVLTDDLIHLMLFKDFNKSSSKSRHFKVKEMFIRQLLQIKGMSVDKAFAIVDKYPTPLLLKLSYNELVDAQKEKLLANIQYGASRKNVGPVLSKTVYQFICKNLY